MQCFSLYSVSEKGVRSFLKSVSDLSNDELCLNFAEAPFLIPFVTLFLLIWIKNRKKQNIDTYAKNFSQCKYLQRMDFFTQCKLDLSEDFTRHPSMGRFFPITQINVTEDNTNMFAAMFADKIANDQKELTDPELTGVYDYICYAISELVNNVLQHSHGTGFCYAQKYPKKNLLRLAIADDGIGIRESLKGSPYQKETDLDSILEAIKPKVSGRAWKFSNDSPNAGVGLSLLVDITRDIQGGAFFICSGNGVCSSEGNYELNNPIHGTICGFTIPWDCCQGQGFNNGLLLKSKRNLKLIDNFDNSFFDEIFL